jgi:hypothetical protein
MSLSRPAMFAACKSVYRGWNRSKKYLFNRQVFVHLPAFVQFDGNRRSAVLVCNFRFEISELKILARREDPKFLQSTGTQGQAALSQQSTYLAFLQSPAAGQCNSATDEGRPPFAVVL